MNQPETQGTPGDHPARRTPYELVYASHDFEARVFPGIRAEAEAQGVEPLHPERFAFLSRVGDAVRSIVPPDAPPEALEQHRALLYHAFNFWRFGKRLYLLDAAVARYLVEAAPALEEWEFAPPHPSIYLQLPPKLFWGSISPDSTPEPVDGFFVASAEAEDPLRRPYRALEVLVVMGIRRDRAGFSVIPFSTETGPGIAQVWAEAPGREEGRDFENVLPGGELAGLYSLLTSAEVLKMLARAIWYIDRFPAAVVPEVAPERRADDRPGSAPRARLPYQRVSLAEPEHGGG